MIMRHFILALLALALALPGAAQFSPSNVGNPQAVVQGWYQRFLRRPMDPAAAGWVQALASGQDPNQLLAGILGSDEYFSNAGGTPAGFVRQLYMDLVGRQPSPAELRHWTARVFRESRTDIAYALLTRHPQDLGQRLPPGRHPFEYRRPFWRF